MENPLDLHRVRLLLELNQGVKGVVVMVLEINLGVKEEVVVVFNHHRMVENKHLRINQEVVRTVQDRLRNKKEVGLGVAGVRPNLSSMGPLVLLEFISRTL